MKIHTLRNKISYLLDLKSNERPFIFINRFTQVSDLDFEVEFIA